MSEGQHNRGAGVFGRLKAALGGTRIRARLIACFIVIVVSMIAADAVTAWQFGRILASNRQLNQADQISLSILRVRIDVHSYADSLTALGSTHDVREFATVTDALRRRFIGDVAQAQQLLAAASDTGNDPAIRSALETLRMAVPSQLNTALELASVGDWAAVSLRVRDQTQSLIELSSLLVERVDQSVSRVRAGYIESGDRAWRQLLIISPLTALLTLLVAIAIGWSATRSITNPLSRLEASTRALAQGEFQHQVEIQGEDELAHLGRVFNNTARQLATLYETLRTNEARFRLIIDTIPAYVWSALPDGSVDFINQRWLEFSGLPRDQALGSGWEVAVHPDDRDRYIQAWRAAISSGNALETEARVRSADGQYRWLLIRNVPLHDATGAIVKWYGTSTDINDRKQAEQALSRSQAYLAESQRLTHTGSWASDSTTAPTYWSEELYRIFGFDPQRGLPSVEEPLQRMHPEDVGKVRQAFQRAISDKVDGDVEYRIAVPGEPVKHVVGIAHPVLNSSGELVELVGTTVDITERKRAEQERQRLRELEADLAHINRVSLLGELAASIAHEVNQPLSGVVSNGGACLRWLAANPPNLEEAQEAARRIVRDGKRAGEVISRIRAMTKRTSAATEKLALNETIQEVLDLVGDEAKRRSVTIRTHFANGLLPVVGDRVQLQQVVLNLVMNAIEAMSTIDERPRELVITVRNVDTDQVQVTVEDSGTGLDQKTMAKIFDPFFTTKAGGMGMGLSISRSIVQAHGGCLWATSKDAPGTMFHFSLPGSQKQRSYAEGA